MNQKLEKFSRSAALALFAGLLAAARLPLAGAAGLNISPEEFDFGWAPDNAKISCEFTVKNMTEEIIPLTAVRPTCGCTATDFTPSNLPSNQETKVRLTFNTRGYTGREFNKTAQVQTGGPGPEYTVKLKGHVGGDAKVAPAGDGIAGFTSASSGKKTITIQNKLAEDVTLSVVQEPQEWAKAKLASDTIKAGQTVNLDVTASGDLDEAKTTSVTFDAKSKSSTERFTVAIRAGAAPAPYRVIPPPSASPAAVPGKPASSGADKSSAPALPARPATKAPPAK